MLTFLWNHITWWFWHLVWRIYCYVLHNSNRKLNINSLWFLSCSDSYQVALRRSATAEMTSDLNTDVEQDSSQIVTSRDRKIKAPLRFISPKDTVVVSRKLQSCSESVASNARPPPVPHQLSAARFQTESKLYYHHHRNNLIPVVHRPLSITDSKDAYAPWASVEFVYFMYQRWILNK